MRRAQPIAGYLLSLPERVVRSASALAGGLLRELGDVALPAAVRRTRLYQNLVETTLRFLIENVGQVEGAYPSGDKLAEDFLIRRAAGNGLELVGLVAFRASPVWVMAALADVTGASRTLIREIAASLKQEGLLEPDAEFSTADEILDGLERTSARLAETINTPPLDIAALRQELAEVRAQAPSIRLPAPGDLAAQWTRLRETAVRENRTVFEVSALMALAAIAGVPENVRWLSRSARAAARATGNVFAGAILDHYARSLDEIREAGFGNYFWREFRPYLRAAAGQFSPGKTSLTERLIDPSKR